MFSHFFSMLSPPPKPDMIQEVIKCSIAMCMDGVWLSCVFLMQLALRVIPQLWHDCPSVVQLVLSTSFLSFRTPHYYLLLLQCMKRFLDWRGGWPICMLRLAAQLLDTISPAASDSTFIKIGLTVLWNWSPQHTEVRDKLAERLSYCLALALG